MFRVLLLLTSALTATLSAESQQLFVPHIDQPENKVEYYVNMPEGKGPFPALILLHGSEPYEDLGGGKFFVKLGIASRIAKMGIVAVSVSQPGFGGSDGMRDYAGPFTRKAVLSVLERLRQNSAIDADCIGIYGISRGAILACRLASETNLIAITILEAGNYDIANSHRKESAYLNLRSEISKDPAVLHDRSGLFYLENINTPTLILHGQYDDRRGLDSAQQLNAGLVKNGIDSSLVLINNSAHILPRTKWEAITPFLRKHLLGIGGIGANLSDPIPYPQVIKLHGSHSSGLKEGDTILAIDGVDIRGWSMGDIVEKVLGPIGTKVRLHVYHWNHEEEDLVVQRR